MNTPSLDERFLLIEEQMAKANEEQALQSFAQCAFEDEKLTAVFIRYLLITAQREAAHKLMQSIEGRGGAWIDAARSMLALSYGDMTAGRKYASLAIAGGAEEGVIYDTLAQAMEAAGLYKQAVAYYAFALRTGEAQDAQLRVLSIISLLLQNGEFTAAQELLAGLPQEAGEDIALPLETMIACAKLDKEKAAALSARLDPENSLLDAAAALQAQMLLGGDKIAALAQEIAQLELPQTDILAADAFLTAADAPRAKALLDRAAADENADANRLISIGHRYQRMECWKEAAACFEKADNGSLPYKYHFLTAAERALCLEKSGSKRESAVLYRQILAGIRKAMLEGYTDTDLYLIQLRCHKALGEKEKMKELYEFACLIAADEETRQLLRKAIEN